MVTQVKSWGNGQGIRFSIVLSKTVKHKTLEERAAAYGGKVGSYDSVSWGEPVGREVW